MEKRHQLIVLPVLFFRFDPKPVDAKNVMEKRRSIVFELFTIWRKKQKNSEISRARWLSIVQRFESPSIVQQVRMVRSKILQWHAERPAYSFVINRKLCAVLCYIGDERLATESKTRVRKCRRMKQKVYNHTCIIR